MPILYILICSILFAAVVAPYRTSVNDFFSTLSADTVADTTTLRSIYRGYTPTSDDPAAEETVNCREVDVPTYNTCYARLTCEALSIDCDLYFGDSTEALKKGACQSISSYLPGYNGQILVGAHNNRHFKNLEHAEIGQVFTLTTNYGIYQYEIYDIVIRNISELDRKSTDAYDFSKRDGEILILYTCYPFKKMAATKTDRFFVYCKKISGPRVVEE